MKREQSSVADMHSGEDWTVTKLGHLRHQPGSPYNPCRLCLSHRSRTSLLPRPRPTPRTLHVLTHISALVHNDRLDLTLTPGPRSPCSDGSTHFVRTLGICSPRQLKQGVQTPAWSRESHYSVSFNVNTTHLRFLSVGSAPCCSGSGHDINGALLPSARSKGRHELLFALTALSQYSLYDDINHIMKVF